MSTIPRHHRFTVEEYFQVAGRGSMRNTRVELIDGAIFDMTPQGAWHVECVRAISEAFIRGVQAGERVYVQSTMQLSRWSAPEPDVVVARTRDGVDRWQRPSASDVLLVVEVSDPTLAYDLETKVPLYERHRIPEVWIVDLGGRRVHVFRRGTHTHEYGDPELVRAPGELRACGVTIEVASLFP